MGFEKKIVIDARGHLLGRLASTVAKQLLEGQRVVVVRCEEINITGGLVRNKLKYLRFLDKACNTNPRGGHYHYRAPAKIFWRTVRGMLPHKLPRGALALSKLKVFEGVPPPYDKTKRVVVPAALRVHRLKPQRKFTVLGRLSQEVGWKYGDVVSRLEERRKVKAAAWYETKKQSNKFTVQATKNVASKVEKETAALKALSVIV
eukprot:TRINITY_DN10925_c0_g1_i1.p1 TRINITY_DN10925_c0_g1~~TRINITY_DN10925_c0_g1_i1.p1  ORF type:complete len:204 (+),score=66.55 TRINITY_DN10925_c0_g1_i1:420-1031(+)